LALDRGVTGQTVRADVSGSPTWQHATADSTFPALFQDPASTTHPGTRAIVVHARHLLDCEPWTLQNVTDKPVKQAEKKRRQVAALPWRGSGADLQILLVSSRETKRWVIPKGWPMKERSDAAAAAQEAFEEAGLDGVIAEQPLGEYEYLKRLKSGAARSVKVDVYALEVTGEHATWPEKGQRTLQWMTPVEAALGVQEPELGT